MNYNKKSVEQIDVAGKRVLGPAANFRNPTKDGKITSDKRIVAALRRPSSILSSMAPASSSAPTWASPRTVRIPRSHLRSLLSACPNFWGPAGQDGQGCCGRKRTVSGPLSEQAVSVMPSKHPL